MFTIGRHTVRCPRCKSDEYLQEAIMADISGEKFLIKTCQECGETYKVEDRKKGIVEMVGAFMGYVLVGFMITGAIASLKVIYIMLRWILIGIWG